MKPLKSLISEAVTEFRQITWPSRKETIRLVTIVIFFSLAMAFCLGLADLAFMQAIQEFILKI